MACICKANDVSTQKKKIYICKINLDTQIYRSFCRPDCYWSNYHYWNEEQSLDSCHDVLLTYNAIYSPPPPPAPTQKQFPKYVPHWFFPRRADHHCHAYTKPAVRKWSHHHLNITRRKLTRCKRQDHYLIVANGQGLSTLLTSYWQQTYFQYLQSKSSSTLLFCIQ